MSRQPLRATAEPLAVRCAAQSLERSEPLSGTASRVQRWLLVEQPGSWGRDALTESGLDSIVADRLGAAARRAGVRVVLIRRPRRGPGASGGADASDTRQIFFAHSSVQGAWVEHLELPAEELDLLADQDLTSLAQPRPPGLGAPGPESVHLVCVNGRHDPCCADLGRPVVRALVAAEVPEVWECSHIGGDRFAANVVCLPEGIYYGRVAPEVAAAVIGDHRAGLIDLDHYRGRSCYPPVVQAAEAFAREHLGERRLAAASVLDVRTVGEITEVDVSAQGAPVIQITVERIAGEPQQLTCRAEESGEPWRYVLRGVRSG
ncbi:sucrase ferredoxin [soil metagenome]